MKKNELLKQLTEGLSLEEIPTLVNFCEIEDLVSNADFDKELKEEVSEKLEAFRDETSTHAKYFARMMKYVGETEKDEY